MTVTKEQIKRGLEFAKVKYAEMSFGKDYVAEGNTFDNSFNKEFRERFCEIHGAAIEAALCDIAEHVPPATTTITDDHVERACEAHYIAWECRTATERAEARARMRETLEAAQIIGTAATMPPLTDRMMHAAGRVAPVTQDQITAIHKAFAEFAPHAGKVEGLGPLLRMTTDEPTPTPSKTDEEIMFDLVEKFGGHGCTIIRDTDDGTTERLVGWNSSSRRGGITICDLREIFK